jgi:3-(3-hydroxy-phenyl)propionate hydroxylase
LAGCLAPQFNLADGRRSDDRVGYAFALLADAAVMDALPPSQSAALAAAGVDIIHSDEAIGLGAWLDANGIRAALVRPDRYVLGSARGADELARLVNQLRSMACVA